MKRRKSRQRDTIYQLIESGGTHPTAAWLLSRMKEEFPGINEANLYRNLKILTEEGKIASRDLGDGMTHYDAVTANHYHFVCHACGRIIDLDKPVEDHVNSLMQKHTSHLIESHTIQFFGVCEDCGKNQQQLKLNR